MAPHIARTLWEPLEIIEAIVGEPAHLAQFVAATDQPVVQTLWEPCVAINVYGQWC